MLETYANTKTELTQWITAGFLSSALAPFSLRVNFVAEVMCSNFWIIDILSPYF